MRTRRLREASANCGGFLDRVGSSESVHAQRAPAPGRYVGREAAGVAGSHVRAVEEACRS